MTREQLQRRVDKCCYRATLAEINAWRGIPGIPPEYPLVWMSGWAKAHAKYLKLLAEAGK